MAVTDGGGGGGGAGGGIDTRVDGEPASISAAASWMGSTAAPRVGDGADAVRRARTDALSDWGGDAGPAFAEQMGGARSKVVALETALTTFSRTLETFSGALATAKSRMADVRRTASAEGLDVSGTTILDPGPGPARPPDRAGEVMPLPELQAYEADVRAYDRHQRLLEAYQRADSSAAAARTDLTRAQQQVVDEYNGFKWSEVATQATDWVSSLALHRLSLFQASALRQSATRATASWESWRQQMAGRDYRALQDLDQRLGIDPRSAYARDAAHLDDLRAEHYRAGAAADAAESRGRFSGAARNISRGLVGVGIVVDLADGESVPQALASNIGGYAAGAVATTLVTGGTSLLAATATGAALGSAVPVVGTAVGAVVGLGVGIFASGAIDSMFKNGPDVSTALDAGADAVTDTVGAVGDGLEAAGDFVGGLFD